MSNFSRHSPNSTPPSFPPVLEQVKDTYKRWIPIQRSMPKGERFGLGQKIDFLFIALLETLHRAAYSPANSKAAFLTEASLTIDSLRFFLQLAWELKLIPSKQFTLIGQEIESIGKMTDGWRKGFLPKTPAEAGEKG